MRSLAVVVCLAPAAAAAADSLDITDYPIVYTAAGTERVAVQKDLPFAAGARTLHFDLYLPPGPKRGLVPVVVFVNGVGDVGPRKLKDWPIYQSWARLVAARGYAAITTDSDSAALSASARALFAALARDGARLGIDAGRVAVWACSANVSQAVPLVMDDPPPGVRAAVFYYGAGPAKKMRADLPVLHILAGKDGPQLLEAERRMRADAAAAHAPWTMVEEPTLPHAFDGVDGSEASRRAVAMTLAFLDAHLGTLPPAPPPSRERDIIAHVYGVELAAAVQGLEGLLAADPKRADAIRLMGLLKARAGDCAGAVTWLERVGAPDAGVLNALGSCQLQAKRYDEAIATFERANVGGAPPHFAYNLACAHALAGHKDAAFAALDQALARGFNDRRLLETDADLAALRSDPRFARVLERLPAR